MMTKTKEELKLENIQWKKSVFSLDKKYKELEKAFDILVEYLDLEIDDDLDCLKCCLGDITTTNYKELILLKDKIYESREKNK